MIDRMRTLTCIALTCIARNWRLVPSPFLLLWMAGCVYLPILEDVPVSKAVPAAVDTRIGRLLGEHADPHVLLIAASTMALTSRLDLIEAAETAIDAQYFIWQNDASGILLIDKLFEAADRGVRVRVLVDDIQLRGMVDRLKAIDDHPNVEIRIFNPFSVRWRFEMGLFRLAEFAIDGNRLNHRMHNKLMVADNQLAILGGRNIGDDYFGRSPDRNFIDTDILLSGAIVPELSEGFDTYWNSRWAYPVQALVNWSLFRDDLNRLRARIKGRLAQHPDLQGLDDPSRIESTVAQLLSGPAVERYITVIDDPDVGWFDRPDEIAGQLTEIALNVEHRVTIVSPYLIPTRNLLDIGETLNARGVEISVLTNSLETNDVVIAQAAYSRSQQQILDSGVRLFELRGDAELAENDRARNVCLHPKYIIFDDDVVFMGSLNLDPRSLYLNTEVGVVLESAALARELRAHFEDLTRAENAWQVIHTADGIRWRSSAGTVKRTPAKSHWQRLRHALLKLLPISDQL